VSIFDGDGRAKVTPINAPPCSKPLAVTKARARKLIKDFGREKYSYHPDGGTMWVIMTYCIEQQLRFAYCWDTRLGGRVTTDMKQ